MIKLSKLTDYAVVLLTAMARRDALASASSLSQETGLPEPTVSKILKLLSKHDVISSVRGVNGGYGLREETAKITVGDIITAIEGPIALTSCVQGSDTTCSMEGSCHLKGRWDTVNMAIVAALEGVTLADMMRPAGKVIRIEHKAMEEANL